MKGRVLSVLVALALVAGCGGTQVLEARPRLGVQDNGNAGSAGPVLLAVRPPPGLQLRTTSEARGDATFLGQQMHLEYIATEERAVLERRPDGTTVMSSRRTGGSMRMVVGDRPREEALEPEPSPSTWVMDARGRSIDDAMFAAPTGGAERSEILRRLLDPLLDAIAYPDHPVAIGERWQAQGTQALSEADARGTVRYALTQELVRVEGSGATAVAFVAFRGEISGEGGIEAGPVTGALRFEGAYTVGVDDGLVRSMQTRLDGSVSLGGDGSAARPPGLLDVPFRGELRYRAE
jgi:hypothetical protein